MISKIALAAACSAPVSLTYKGNQVLIKKDDIAAMHETCRQRSGEEACAETVVIAPGKMIITCGNYSKKTKHSK